MNQKFIAGEYYALIRFAPDALSTSNKVTKSRARISTSWLCVI